MPPLLKCSSHGCNKPVAWECTAKSAHAAPRTIVTHWCEGHATELKNNTLTKTAQWVKIGTTI